MREKRKFERVPLHVTVLVETDCGFTRVGEATDLALGGMFLEGIAAPFASTVRIRLVLPGTNDIMTLPAVVRWVRSNGCGVQFGLLGARETHAIMNVVASARASTQVRCD